MKAGVLIAGSLAWDASDVRTTWRKQRLVIAPLLGAALHVVGPLHAHLERLQALGSLGYMR